MVALNGTHNGTRWRLAPALQQLLDEVDDLAPNRSILSDGSIASAAHTIANPTSDHEIDLEGDGNWVDAIDLTDDPAHGADMTRLVGLIVANRDERLDYVIHDDTIWRSYDRPGLPAWTPEPYRGKNPHQSHAHFSVNDTHRHDTRPWLTMPQPSPAPVEEDDDMAYLVTNKKPTAKYPDAGVLLVLGDEIVGLAEAADVAAWKSAGARAVPMTGRGYTDLASKLNKTS